MVDPNNMITTQEYNQLCRAQRQAYFAWQAAPAGDGAAAIQEYLRAAAALREAQETAK